MTITAQELIKQLSQLPPDTPVYAWIEGDREEIDEVDTTLEGYADINIAVRI